METKGTFTHFLCVPMISHEARQIIGKYQEDIMTKAFLQQQQKVLRRNNPNFFHITICMLALTAQTRPKADQIMKKLSQKIRELLKEVTFKFSKLKCFKGKYNKQVAIIYLDIIKDEGFQRFLKAADLLIRQMVKQEVIYPNQLKAMHIEYDHNKGVYRPKDMHLTLFRTDSNLVKMVNFDEVMKRAQEFQINQSFPIETVDISKRNTKDQITKFCIPLSNIVI